MKFLAGSLAALFVLAGCAGADKEPPTTSASPSSPTYPPPTQVLVAQGNNDQCTEVLTADETHTFQVNASYDQIEVAWHATGIGQVGYTIRSPDGSVVVDQADYNPNTPPPCTHQHGPGGAVFDAAPGEYSVTVRNAGAVGWMLVVVARHSASNATHEGHDA